MKMLKYILIASIFTMTSLVGYSASEATTTPTATEQKGLTEEELYQKQQAELDKQMVEKVDEIRGRLKKFVREVRKVSPATADLLLKAARKVNHEWCRWSVQACQVLDRRMKSEKGMDNEAELKLFLVELAGRR